MTHNHPGGMTFSVEDMQLAAQYKFQEIRAVTGEYRHIATDLGGVWHGAIDVAYHENLKRLRPAVTAMVRNDTINARNFTTELRHQAWLATAKQLGFTYWRERS